MRNEAKQFIKNELKKRKITYSMLSLLMKKKGYEYSDNTIRSKINRGSYSFTFLLEVCDTLKLILKFEEIPKK
ncbi:MAG: hypothetical protein DSZ07_07395 [Sulfurovum sp.]|nr:MAG: hypothetical protein DSZ07_07395 [Sulfurovum sp.]